MSNKAQKTVVNNLNRHTFPADDFSLSTYAFFLKKLPKNWANFLGDFFPISCFLLQIAISLIFW